MYSLCAITCNRDESRCNTIRFQLRLLLWHFHFRYSQRPTSDMCWIKMPYWKECGYYTGIKVDIGLEDIWFPNFFRPLSNKWHILSASNWSSSKIIFSSMSLVLKASAETSLLCLQPCTIVFDFVMRHPIMFSDLFTFRYKMCIESWRYMKQMESKDILQRECTVDLAKNL